MCKRRVLTGLLLFVAWGVAVAQAGGLGIPLDAFLAQYATFIIGTGFLVGVLGLWGWGAAHLNNTFGTFLGGSPNLFGTMGLLGGATVIMGLLGLTQGATLPL